MDYNLEVMDLSVASYNCLRRAGINTVNQLLSTPLEDLKRVRNLGSQRLIEVQDRIIKWDEIKKTLSPADAIDENAKQEAWMSTQEFCTVFLGLDSQRRNLLLEALSERERDVIESKFGLNGKKKQTLDEIGKRYGVTRERIRQLQERAIVNLKYRYRQSRNLVKISSNDIAENEEQRITIAKQKAIEAFCRTLGFRCEFY